MMREQKKRLRLQLSKLLDRCEGCEHIGTVNIGVHICKSCPLGRQIQAIGRKLVGRERNNKTTRVRWTREEEVFLWRNQHLPRAQLADQLGRTIAAVHSKIEKMRKNGGVKIETRQTSDSQRETNHAAV